jgi:hypothetical protein
LSDNQPAFTLTFCDWLTATKVGRNTRDVRPTLTPPWDEPINGRILSPQVAPSLTIHRAASGGLALSRGHASCICASTAPVQTVADVCPRNSQCT